MRQTNHESRSTERKKQKKESFQSSVTTGKSPSNYQIDRNIRNISEKVTIRHPISNNYLKDSSFVRMKWRKNEGRQSCGRLADWQFSRGKRIPLARNNQGPLPSFLVETGSPLASVVSLIKASRVGNVECKQRRRSLVGSKEPRKPRKMAAVWNWNGDYY